MVQVYATPAILHKTTNPNSQLCMSGSAFLYSAPLLRTPEDYRKLTHSVTSCLLVLMTFASNHSRAQCVVRLPCVARARRVRSKLFSFFAQAVSVHCSPECFLQVFLRVYLGRTVQSNHCWGRQDRNTYKRSRRERVGGSASHINIYIVYIYIYI